LLESAYEARMVYELQKKGVNIQSRVTLPVIYDGEQINIGYKVDLLVNKCVIVELKAVEKIQPIFEAQLLNYMKLSGVRLGYLLNFNIVRLKHGIKRMMLYNLYGNGYYFVNLGVLCGSKN